MMDAVRTASVFFLALPILAQPHLLLDPAGIQRIQATAAAEPWAREVVDSLIRRADRWPQSHIEEYGLKEWALPTEGAGWSHAYVCPEHGMRLQQKAGHNICPVDGKDHHGYPIDNVVYMQRNSDNVRAARDLGLAFLLTGNGAYAAKARRIINAYSPLYKTLPIHDVDNKLNTPRGARVMCQTLSEAGWLVPLVFAYDLVRDTMPQAERDAFETNVLREAAQVIAKYDMKKSNWQSWHNAAILAVGLTVNDKALIEKAINGPSGFNFQMRESITPDGPWFEGAWGYHFFSVEPLMLTYEMARRASIALPEASALARMLDAPERAVFPDNSLPNFNDSGLVQLPPRRKPFDRLLWGESPFPRHVPSPLQSDLMPDAGIATLRVSGSDHTLAIKFGPHGGGHGHNDKLTFISYANGRHLAADPGTQAYAAKTHATWDKTTIAHNTIAIDEQSQLQAAGKLLEWKPGPDKTVIRLSAGPAYKNVELTRTMVHTARYTLDIFEAKATDGRPHKIDWIYHNYGTASTDLNLQPGPEFPQTNGYQHLTNQKFTKLDTAWRVDFTGLRLHMLPAPETTVVLGQGLGPDLRVPVPFALARRTAERTTFVALYEPVKDKPQIQSIRQLSPTSFEIHFPDHTETVNIPQPSSPGKQSTAFISVTV